MAARPRWVFDVMNIVHPASQDHSNRVLEAVEVHRIGRDGLQTAFDSGAALFAGLRAEASLPRVWHLSG
jgi:hypothetical protein